MNTYSTSARRRGVVTIIDVLGFLFVFSIMLWAIFLTLRESHKAEDRKKRANLVAKAVYNTAAPYELAENVFFFKSTTSNNAFSTIEDFLKDRTNLSVLTASSSSLYLGNYVGDHDLLKVIAYSPLSNGYYVVFKAK